MYLIGHTAVGIAAVKLLGITNPVAAFGIGWLSHYVVDFIPHGDEPVGEWAKRGNEVQRIVVVFLIDCVIIIGVTAAFIMKHGWSWPYAIAAVGSTIPDVLWGLDLVFKHQLIRPLSKFHFRNHNYLHRNLPFVYGLVLQCIASGALWAWVILG